MMKRLAIAGCAGWLGGFVGNAALGALFSSPWIRAALYNPALQSQLFIDVTPQRNIALSVAEFVMLSGLHGIVFAQVLPSIPGTSWFTKGAVFGVGSGPVLLAVPGMVHLHHAAQGARRTGITRVGNSAGRFFARRSDDRLGFEKSRQHQLNDAMVGWLRSDLPLQANERPSHVSARSPFHRGRYWPYSELGSVFDPPSASFGEADTAGRSIARLSTGTVYEKITRRVQSPALGAGAHPVSDRVHPLAQPRVWTARLCGFDDGRMTPRSAREGAHPAWFSPMHLSASSPSALWAGCSIKRLKPRTVRVKRRDWRRLCRNSIRRLSSSPISSRARPIDSATEGVTLNSMATPTTRSLLRSL